MDPLLFIIIKPLSIVIQHFSKIKYHIYADDILIYTSYNDTSSIHDEHLSICVYSINHWFLANKLLLNKSKIELLNIPNHRDNFPDIMVDIESIKTSQSITYMGIVIDSVMGKLKRLARLQIMLCIK